LSICLPSNHLYSLIHININGVMIMKELVVLYGNNCGYCKKAKMLIKRALEKETKYTALNIRFVLDEDQEGKNYPHTLIPAFYCDGEMFFEGNPNMDIVMSTLKDCYE
jgi:hypothetical protein